jgi:hypothetical protein
MNISMRRWERALAIAKRTNKFIEVVVAYRTKFIQDMGVEEIDPEFVKLGQIDMSRQSSNRRRVVSDRGKMSAGINTHWNCMTNVINSFSLRLRSFHFGPCTSVSRTTDRRK